MVCDVHVAGVLADFRTLGYAYFSMAHAQNGDFKLNLQREI